MATHQPRETRSSGTLKRGELVASMRTLGDRWKWPKDNVQRFINALKTKTAIETVSETPDGTVYRIVNYDTYAVSANGDRDSERDSDSDRSATEARQEQEQKHLRRTDLPQKRKHRLPDDWVPSDSHRERAARDHLNLDGQAEKFRNHHLAKGTVMLDWDRAFFTWLGNSVDFARNGHTSNKPPGKRPGYLTPAPRYHADS